MPRDVEFDLWLPENIKIPESARPPPPSPTLGLDINRCIIALYQKFNVFFSFTEYIESQIPALFYSVSGEIIQASDLTGNTHLFSVGYQEIM